MVSGRMGEQEMEQREKKGKDGGEVGLLLFTRLIRNEY